MNNRISVADAEQFAGVSRATLMRFAEAGYFSVEEDSSGSPIFLKKELCDLFNIDLEDLPAESPETATAAYDNTARNEDANPASEEIQQDACGRSAADYSTTARNFMANATEGSFAGNPSSTADESDTEVDDASDYSVEEESEAAFATTESETENETKPEAVSETEPPVSPTAITPEEDFAMAVSTERESTRNSAQAEEVHALTLDIQKLKRVIELQEQLLDLRESEITDLKSQREWLQRRVEKGEDTAEREQLLLISEMQMLSKLVAEQTRKRSPVVAALEWLGIKDPAPVHIGNTIDYQAHRERRDEKQKKEKAA